MASISMAKSVPKVRRRLRAASGAERQAAYRRRHLNEVDTLDSARLNTVVPVATKRALVRLAKRYAVTQRETLVKLIEDAERTVTQELTSADLRRYYRDAKTD
jgi:macrodomain Ter protein organizer (MatP/YcbG family)